MHCGSARAHTVWNWKCHNSHWLAPPNRDRDAPSRTTPGTLQCRRDWRQITVPIKNASEQSAGITPYATRDMPNSPIKTKGESSRKQTAPLKLIPASSDEYRNCALLKKL